MLQSVELALPGGAQIRRRLPAEQPNPHAGTGHGHITELLADGWIGPEHIRRHEDIPETAALTAMHREHCRRPQGSEGIANQKVLPSDRATVFLAGITGLLAQPLHHRIELLTTSAANRRLQAQG